MTSNTPRIPDSLDMQRLQAMQLVARMKEDPPDVIYMVSYLNDGAVLVTLPLHDRNHPAPWEQ